jgi:hypothetical protein
MTHRRFGEKRTPRNVVLEKRHFGAIVQIFAAAEPVSLHGSPSLVF